MDLPVFLLSSPSLHPDMDIQLRVLPSSMPYCCALQERLPQGPRNAWERALWEVQTQDRCPPSTPLDTILRYCAAFALLAYRRTIPTVIANRLDAWLCSLEDVIVEPLPQRTLGSWRLVRGIAWLHGIAISWTPWEDTWARLGESGAYFTTTHASTSPALQTSWWDTDEIKEPVLLERWSFHGVNWFQRLWLSRWDDDDEQWVSSYEEDVVSGSTRREILRNVLMRDRGLNWNKIPASSRIPSLLDLGLHSDEFDDAICAQLNPFLNIPEDYIRQVLRSARSIEAALDDILQEVLLPDSPACLPLPVTGICEMDASSQRKDH